MCSVQFWNTQCGSKITSNVQSRRSHPIQKNSLDDTVTSQVELHASFDTESVDSAYTVTVCK